MKRERKFRFMSRGAAQLCSWPATVSKTSGDCGIKACARLEKSVRLNDPESVPRSWQNLPEQLTQAL